MNANDNHNKLPSINPPVFWVSAIGSIIIGLIMIFSPTEKTTEVLTNTQNYISDTLGWYYIFIVAFCLFFVIWLAFSKYKNIKLSQADEDPEFSFGSWVAMLFSAGIGIGILYYGAYEGLYHFVNPPVALASKAEQVKEAMVITFLHWGLHGWALYALMGTVLAYFTYRKNLPLTLRSPLFAIFGNKIDGGIGHVVDGFGIIATLISLITNLGMGALFIYTGLTYLVEMPELSSASGSTWLVSLTIILMGSATLVAVTGIKKGISPLANFNILLMILFLLFIFFSGKPVFLLNAFLQNIGEYLNAIVHKSFNVYLYEDASKSGWLSGWTIFYWAWWIAWAPFVSLFIARISKGRTIKELILGVLTVPLGFSLLWMTVFGNTAIDLMIEGSETLAVAVNGNIEESLFALIAHFPFSQFMTGLIIFIGFVMFLTPVDSGLIMVSNLCVKNLPSDSEDAPAWIRVFWAVMITLLSIGLLFSGNFSLMQSAVVICGLPFSVVIIFYMISLVKALKSEDLS